MDGMRQTNPNKLMNYIINGPIRTGKNITAPISPKHVSEALNITSSTVRHTLERLKNKGWLTIYSRESGCSQYLIRKDVYALFSKKKVRGASVNPSSKGVRFDIFQRDNFRCKICGASPATDPTARLEIDHIVPISRGGKNEINNLQTLCYDCNRGKKDTLM